MGCTAAAKLCRSDELDDRVDEVNRDTSDKLTAAFIRRPKLPYRTQVSQNSDTCPFCGLGRTEVPSCAIGKQCLSSNVSERISLEMHSDYPEIALDTSESVTIAPPLPTPIEVSRPQSPCAPKAKAKKRKCSGKPKPRRKNIDSGSSETESVSRKCSKDEPKENSCTASSTSYPLTDESVAAEMAAAFQPLPVDNACEFSRDANGQALDPYFFQATNAVSHQTISGWLMKKKGTHRPIPLARGCAGSCGHGFFWKRSYFDLGPEYLTYSSVANGSACGAYNLGQIDGVVVHGKEILLHFVVRQKTGHMKRTRQLLVLRADTASEAECWGDFIRTATAARWLSVLPRVWDVKTMLTESGKEGQPFNLVSEVPLPPAPMMAVQRLVDHAFVCKRTRDRGEHDLPVRLEVVKVVRVQNSTAWIKYSKAREKVRGDQELVPPIMTSTHEDQMIPLALGELDRDSNEHWFFHGTSQAGVEGIARGDFRLELAGTHRGTMYGNGVYFAECSSKADEYAYEEDGLCRMLLCRVVLGRVLVDQSARPDGEDLANKCALSYDSLCGDRWAAVGTFREFILYNQEQVYPAYIVLYRRIGQAELLQSIGQAAEQQDFQSAARFIACAAGLAESHPDPIVRYRISMLLAARTSLVVPALTSCLRDPRRPLRRMAAVALGKLGAHTTPAVAGLAEASDLCKAVAASTVPALTTHLKDESADVREACALALQRFGFHAASAVPALSQALQDSAPGVREAVATCLGQLGASAALAIPRLELQLQDNSSGARQAAAAALGWLCITGPGAHHAGATVVALVDCLADPSVEVRQAAATSLGKIGAQATSTPAIDGLKTCLDDNDALVRQAAATALGQLGGPATSAVPELTLCLHDDAGAVRSAAATALGRLGAAAISAIQPLKHALKDTDIAVVCAACFALGQIAAQPSCAAQAATVVHALTRCLKEIDAEVRKSAATALGQLGMHVVPALPSLVERIKDSSPEVRKAAATALSMLGENSAPALAALAELLNDSNEDVRRKASSAISDINRRLSTAGQSFDGEALDLSTFSFLSYYKFAKPSPRLAEADQTPSEMDENVGEEGVDASYDS